MLLVDSRNPALTPPPRFHLWKNGSLEVDQVQMDDTGDYRCEIMTEAEKAIQRHAIEVQCEWELRSIQTGIFTQRFIPDPPNILMHPSDRVEVKVGQILEIVCDATGVPQPYISWSFKVRPFSL